jgi:hypothetical protein
VLDTKSPKYLEMAQGHISLSKRKKVKSKSSSKYVSSSDEDDASDEEDNLRTLFANLNMQQKEKLNEFISAIHEKDDLLDTQ